MRLIPLPTRSSFPPRRQPAADAEGEADEDRDDLGQADEDDRRPEPGPDDLGDLAGPRYGERETEVALQRWSRCRRRAGCPGSPGATAGRSRRQAAGAACPGPSGRRSPRASSGSSSGCDRGPGPASRASSGTAGSSGAGRTHDRDDRLDDLATDVARAHRSGPGPSRLGGPPAAEVPRASPSVVPITPPPSDRRIDAGRGPGRRPRPPRRPRSRAGSVDVLSDRRAGGAAGRRRRSSPRRCAAARARPGRRRRRAGLQGRVGQERVVDDAVGEERRAVGRLVLPARRTCRSGRRAGCRRSTGCDTAPGRTRAAASGRGWRGAPRRSWRRSGRRRACRSPGCTSCCPTSCRSASHMKTWSRVFGSGLPDQVQMNRS